MSERMSPIPFGDLMRWILAEYEQSGSLFGVERPFIAEKGKKLPLFRECIETPFGPAAGPHTQLAQNIVTAYWAGARFFELKTVQIMDGEELARCIARPCILAEDEGYNCEWSTELTVEQALEEYIKAWFICKLLSREYGLGDPDGFVFNMSVGYDFAGITSEKIDHFIEGLKDASNTDTFKACREWALSNLRLFENVNARYIEGISPRVCTSITLSTLHGCPPQEIERIASYLISKKKLHTFVKCNPTILGYETARRTLDSMGYDYIQFDDHHFKEDLQYEDAVPMFRRLRALAAENGVDFGLKLSNTFPVDVKNNELPSAEMYMSGRALYPLTIEMANRLTAEFDGMLRLSFSGGADAFNIVPLYEAGIWPITVATTILKSGGYQRMLQLARRLARQEYKPFEGVSVARVANLAQAALTDPHHRKPEKPIPPRKIDERLPLTSCFTAPCTHGCPIHQDIPEYITLVGKGKHLKALRVITEKNPLPFITGVICAHHCTDKCTRNDYEGYIRIRNAKLEAARGGYEALLGELETPVMTSDKRAAVIGGGPAGLSAAYFLGRAGMPVTLFDEHETLGGVVRHVIPEFRIPGHAIDRDIQLVEKMGVKFKLGEKAPSVKELREQGYDYVLFAIGAWAPGKLKLEQGEAMNALSFLAACKAGNLEFAGKNVCVVGGGNTAMDAARAAKRIPGVQNVRIVYRRNKKYMPADEEELHLCMREGIEFCELLSPVSLADGKLTCRRMRLGEPDASGRRSPVETEETVKLPCDLLVAAVGEKVDASLFEQNGIQVDARGFAAVDANTLMTNVPGVYVVGDAHRGPATVVEAIADAQRAANHILGARHEYEIPDATRATAAECRARVGELREYDNAVSEANRCLYCSTSCEICMQVCPNRANLALRVPGMQMRQIVHVDRMCNECGNCAVFCPYNDAPYLVKPTLYHTRHDFDDSKNPGFLHLGAKRFQTRLDSEVREVNLDDADTDLPKDFEALLWAVLTEYSHLL